MDTLTQWATLLSPIISVIAIIVALIVARSSSKNAQEQIDAIRNLLDVFVAANNLDIIEAQRKYQRQLIELDQQITEAKTTVETVSPFVSAVRIERAHAAQEKIKQIEYLNELLAKRKEIEVNLSLIQNYIKKATR